MQPTSASSGPISDPHASDPTSSDPSHPQPPPPQHVIVVIPPEPTPIQPQPVFLYRIPENRQVRHWFIFKVYMILFAQLTFVALLTLSLLAFENARNWMRENEWMYIVALCVYFVLLIILFCFDNVRRQWPTNLVLLLLFTAATGYMTALVASCYSTWVVLTAFGVTALSCLAVTLFSLQTRCDLTKWTGILAIVTFSLFIFAMLLCLTWALPVEFKFLHVVYSGIAAVLFMAWLAVDTQMLMGNKKLALKPDEYIYAALQLFLDVIYIFWNLLSLIGGVHQR